MFEFLLARLRAGLQVFTSIFGNVSPYLVFAFLSSCRACEGWLGYIALNAGLYLLLSMFLFVAHELSHAVVGTALGLKLYAVQIGTGHPLKTWEWRGVRLSIGSTWFGAFTQLAPRGGRWMRLRLWLTYAAGPGMHVLILAALALFTEDAWLGNPRRFSHAVEPWLLLAGANWLLLVFNLLPIPANLGGIQTLTDGARMLTVPFASKRALERFHEMGEQLEAMVHVREGRFEEALTLLPERTVEDVEDVMLQLQRAAVLLDAGQGAQARDLLLRLRTFPKLGPFREALLDNAIAWSAIVLDDATLLPDAELRSSAALKTFPGLPAVRFTRASVLLRQGQVDVGLPEVESVWGKIEDPFTQAEIACMLAEGHGLRGHRPEAEAWLEKARALAPNCPMLGTSHRRVTGEHPAVQPPVS